MTAATKTRPATHFLGKCLGEGHPMRKTLAEVQANRAVRRDGDYFRCECGRLALVKPIKGRIKPAIVCDSRCTGATGPACDCSCGGDNHGGAHA
jgi:hypothetical protein